MAQTWTMHQFKQDEIAVTEFLINGFKQSQFARPPYPETVAFL